MITNRNRPVLMLFAWLAFMLLACDGSSIYEEGVTRVCQNGSELVIFAPLPADQLFNQTFVTKDGDTGYSRSASYVHVSRDGGTFWRTMPELLPLEEHFSLSETLAPYREVGANCQLPYYYGYYSADDFPTTGEIAVPQGNLQLRWFADDRIEVSHDGGASWQTEFELTPLQQEVRDYYHYTRGNDYDHIVTVLPAPISALYEESSGNVIFAMGFDGLLVRDGKGNYQWVAVGDYGLRHLQLGDLWATHGGGDDYFSTPLGFHYFLMAALAALVLVQTIAIIQQSGWLVKGMLGIGWLGWVLLVVLSKPVGTLDGIILPGMIALGLTVIIALPLTIWALYHYFTSYITAWKAIVITALLANVAFALPLVLWVLGIIPAYGTASGLALLATGVILVLCRDYLVPRLPEKVYTEKTKRKNDELKAKPEPVK